MDVSIGCVNKNAWMRTGFIPMTAPTSDVLWNVGCGNP